MNCILATFLSPLVYIISEHITPLFNYPIMIIILVIYYFTIPSTVMVHYHPRYTNFIGRRLPSGRPEGTRTGRNASMYGF